MPSDPNIKKRLRTLLLKKAAMIKKAEPPTWYNEGAKRIGSFLEDALRESRPYVESAKNRTQAFLEDVAETARPYVESAVSGARDSAHQAVERSRPYVSPSVEGTKKVINRAAQEITPRVGPVVLGAKERLDQLAETGRPYANEFLRTAGTLAEEGLRRVRQYIESARSAIGPAVQQLRELLQRKVEQTPKSRTNTQLPPWEIQRILAEERLRQGIRIPQRQEIVGPELVIPESNEQEPPRTPETNLFPILSQPQPTHELPPWESRPTAPSSPLAGETGTPLLPQLEPESAPPSTAEAIARNFLIDAIRSGVQVVPMGTQEEQAEWQLPPPPPAPPAPDWGPVTYEVPSAPSSAAPTPDFPVSPAPPLPFASDLVETPAPLTPTVTPTQTAPTPSPPVYYYYPTYRRPLLRRPIIRRPIIRRPIFRRPIFRRFR